MAQLVGDSLDAMVSAMVDAMVGAMISIVAIRCAMFVHWLVSTFWCNG